MNLNIFRNETRLDQSKLTNIATILKNKDNYYFQNFELMLIEYTVCNIRYIFRNNWYFSIVFSITFAAHKNVKVFISHCGLLGFQEAMYHATPIVGMPIGVDQKKNAGRVENQGLGLVVNWSELTEERLTAAIQEVMNNLKWVNLFRQP